MKEKSEKLISAQGLLESIREKIIKGIYKDGESLTEVKLAEEYGTSRTPIREALRRLEAEGLVKNTPNKGSVANRLKASEISDVFNIRIRVESMAAYLAAKNITSTELEELRKAQCEFEQDIRTGNEGHVKQTDSKFHNIIYEAADSMPVKRVLQSMNSYMSLVRYESLKSEGRVAEAAKEHAAILEAIEKGDANLAEKLAYMHVLNAAKHNMACSLLPMGGENLKLEV